MLLGGLLVAGWLWGMWRLRASAYSLALLSLGSTWLHEMCHLLMGYLLRARPVSFSLLPHREGDYWVMGSVGFTNLNLWNAAPVAFAPLGLIGLGALIFQEWLLPAVATGAYLSALIASYGVACCFFSCLPSATDLRQGAGSAVLYGVVGYLLWVLG